MGIARLKSQASDEGVRDAYVEGWINQIFGFIAGLGLGAAADAVTSSRNGMFTVAQNIAGFGSVIASLLGGGPKFIVRNGIPLGFSFASGANAWALFGTIMALLGEQGTTTEQLIARVKAYNNLPQ